MQIPLLHLYKWICAVLQICTCRSSFSWNQVNMNMNRHSMTHCLNYFFHILGVYELSSFLMKPGGPALWGEAFQRAVNAHVNQGYSKLIGVFHSEYGTLNRGTDVYFFSNLHVYWWPIYLLAFFSKSSYVIDKFLYFYHFKELISCQFIYLFRTYHLPKLFWNAKLLFSDT